MKSFDEFNRDIESRSRYWTSDESHFAKEMYEAGQQSKQAEVDALQKKIDEAWMWCEKGCVLKAMEILKGEETK